MNSAPIEDDDFQETRYRLRDLLATEPVSQSAAAQRLGCTKASVCTHISVLRKEGYTVYIVEYQPGKTGKGVGEAVYSIDSRPQPPVVKNFSLDALWHPRKAA